MAKLKTETLTEAAIPIRAPGNLTTAIRTPKTAEIIADHIRKQIISGELKENDFLPLEGQLMQSLGISRPTLREAFRILEAEMLISVVRGSRTGARVHAPRAESVSRYAGFLLQAQKTTISDVYAARLAIEPFVVRTLAERRKPADIARLRQELHRLNNLVDEERYVDFMIGLAEFHRVLVELGGNRTLLLITIILQDVVAKYQVDFLKKRNVRKSTSRERALLGVRSFDKLIQIIESGDADRAEEHWRLHMINSNKAWLVAAPPGLTIDVLS